MNGIVNQYLIPFFIDNIGILQNPTTSNDQSRPLIDRFLTVHNNEVSIIPQIIENLLMMKMTKTISKRIITTLLRITVTIYSVIAVNNVKVSED